ncbi:GNAT family N-acetyltransferase, partial [Acinetobacter baumannii]
TLKQKDQIIGVFYGMRLHHRSYFYQMGFNPEFGSISPGNLLLSFAIRTAIEDGSKEFDFLRGDEPYKRRWQAQHSITNYRHLEAMPSIQGRF